MDNRNQNAGLINSSRYEESSPYVIVSPPTVINPEIQSSPGQQQYISAHQQRIPSSFSPPTGRWHDGLCNCFANLWPSCLCVTVGGYSGLCLTVYLAGQISTRIGWIKTTDAIRWYAAAIVLFWIIGIAVGSATHNTGGTVFLFYVPYIAAFIFFLILRYKFVAYFQIPEDSCNTFCTAFWCSPCSICQMARHMYGYKRLLDGDAKLDGDMEYV